MGVPIETHLTTGAYAASRPLRICERYIRSSIYIFIYIYIYIHPVEIHIRSEILGIKDLLKLRDYTRHTLERDLNGTARIPVPYDGDKRSLQASSEYDAPRVSPAFSFWRTLDARSFEGAETRLPK